MSSGDGAEYLRLHAAAAASLRVGTGLFKISNNGSAARVRILDCERAESVMRQRLSAASETLSLGPALAYLHWHCNPPPFSQRHVKVASAGDTASDGSSDLFLSWLPSKKRKSEADFGA